MSEDKLSLRRNVAGALYFVLTGGSAVGRVYGGVGCGGGGGGLAGCRRPRWVRKRRRHGGGGGVEGAGREGR